jgi:hypothetical protein
MMYAATVCDGACSALGAGSFHQTASDVLVQHTGDERLVRNAFLKRLNLNVTQVAGR